MSAPLRVVRVGVPQLLDGSAPLLRPDDLGLTRGDGCFDVANIRPGTTGPAVADLEAHLARLARSAAALEITIPARPAWLAALDVLLAGWDGAEAVVKFVATRGPEAEPQLGPTAFVSLVALDPSVIAQRAGIRVITLDRGFDSTAFMAAPWLLGNVKSLSYAVNMAAKREAARRGAHDVIFVSRDGYALEGPNSGLVWLISGVLGTTTLVGTGILDSITVARAEAGATSEGQPWQRGLLPVDELATVDGLWLLSSGRGVAPVTELDGRRLPVNTVMTRRLRAWTGFDWVTGVDAD